MSKQRKRRFWYHYNKPESKRQERNVLTLHWKGKCHLIHSLECHVSTQTHDRKTQPRCIIRGMSRWITITYKERLITIQPEILGGLRVRQPIYHAIIQ